MMTLRGIGRDTALLYKSRYWAEDGLIHVVSEDTGAYESMSVHKALEHMNGLQEMLNNTRSRDDAEQEMFIREHVQRFLEKMIDIVRKAQEQGMPSDPQAGRERVRRRPLSLNVGKVPSF